MRPDLHTEFILSSISDILQDAVAASSGIGNGIETFPLCDYMMQSVFLKMTGFQEQKMKCICWELATVDYQYRYDFLTNPVGECSSYSEKQRIYKDLIQQIEKHGLGFPSFGIDRRSILRTTLSSIKNTFEGTNLSIWSQSNFQAFQTISQSMSATHFLAEKGSLFSDATLKKIYEDHLYRQRNRIAHNTFSFQQNLPTLKTLADVDYKYENYFIFFAVLILIDSIFIELYKKYLTMIEDNKI